MSEPTPEPSSQDRDATLISSPLAEVQTHSSLTPQEHTSAGETKAATPNSGVVDVGSQLGPYKLVDKLGEGGMGAVYKARHTKLGKFVAMKILPQHVMSRSDALARFEREMLAVGSLHHPNIVQAHDAGEFGGVHYLSMEYVEGQDLQQLVKAKGPMSVVNACKAIRQAAQGLAAAHKLGLVHRDIKPSNLFVTKQSGQIKILDMGLALLSQEEVPAALTSTGQCFGTPDYMAPEQWSDAHTCDARADLYSLGCTLFFLLVGHPPYHSETHRTAANKMKGHVIDPIPDLLAARSAAVGWKRTSDRSSSLHSSPPSSGERRGEGADFKTGPLTLPLSPEDGGRGDKRTDEVVPPTSDIPDSLNAIYLKLMAKAPEDRFASADQLAEALTPFTRQASIQGNSSRQAAPAQIDPPQRADSLAGNKHSASALVPKHDAATMGQPPVDQLGATSTWAGSSDAAASRSAGASQAAAGPLAAAPSRPDRNRLFIAGGAAAFVLLLGVIIITITNKDGTKTMIEVPGTDSASRAASAAGQAKSHVSEPTGKSVFDLNREAAEWAHGRGATLFLVPDGGVVLPADELPKTPFIVVHSEFREGANVTNLELDPLKRVRHLRLFAITSPQLPEGLLDVLQAQPWLYQLQIESAGMRTSELARSKSWDTLLSLVISVSSQILDDEWRFLERCPSLQRLRVGGIEQLPNLMPRLSDLPNLRNLDLYDATTVDEQAVAALQVKNPHMRVTVGRGAGSRVVGRDPVRDAIQALLGQNAKVFGINYGRGVPEEITSDNLNDATPWLVAEIHLEATTRCTEENQRHLASLESGQFLTLIAGQNVDADEWARAMSRRRLVQNFYTSGAGFTDEGLAHLQHASDIRNFAFIGTRVTRAGLDRFRRVHPTCTINSDLGKFEPDYEAVPEPISPKQSSIQPTGWHGWPADAPKPAIAPFNAEQAKKHQEEWAAYLKVPVEYTNSIGMKFRLIPPGEFMMGSSEIEVEAALANAVGNKDWMEHIRSERPAHRVILTQPFYLGRHEVTQSQFASVTGKNPSQYASTGKQREIVEGMDTAAHPVETVSWDDAFTFCNQLSRSEGLEMAFDPSATPASLRLKAGYRLPTEGEWEFACRAGTETRFWTGDDPAQLTEAAWFQGPRGTHSVGSLKPNPFGLFDVHGNVFEWVFDNWSADYYGDFLLQSAIDPTGPEVSTRRGIRGGPFSITATACRSAGRHATQKEFKDEALGFRAAVSVDAVREAMRRRSNTGWHGWPADAPKPAIAPFDAAQAKKHQEEWAKYLNLPVQWTNSIGMTFQLIPPAEFTMGSSPEQVAATVKVYGDASWKNWAPSEGPQHRVVLTRPFYLGTHEVRQRDYESVMGNNPSGFAKTGKNPMYADLVKGLDTSDHPVETVSWFDAAEFCAKLAMNEGLSPAYATGMRPTFPIEGNGYRLPTEAEWEFTARAGSTTDSWNGDGPARLAEIAWCAANSGGRTHPVGQRLANPFGLFDMQGQVWEWCQDGWTQDGYQRRVAAPVIDPLEAPGQYVRKVVRGSFVTDDLVFSYATIRRAFDPNNGGDSYGLRVAIGIDAVAAKLNRPLPKQTAPIAKSNPFVASSDWKAARFLLDQGAAISIKIGGTYVDLSGRDKPLPMEPFRLVLVWCVDASRLTKDQIRELSRCPSLMTLTLAQLSLTDDDVKPLTEIRSLSSLSLSGPKLTTQSLAAFAGASQLEVFSSWDTLPAESMSDALSKLTRLRDAQVRYLKAEDLLEWSKQPSFARIRALHLGAPEGLTDDMIAEIQSRNPKVAIDVDNKIRGKWLTTDYINRMRSRGFVFIGKEYETNGANVRDIVVDSQNGPPTETPYAIFGLKIQPDATFTLDDLRELNLFHLLVSIDAADVPLNDEALEILTANVAAGRLYTMNFSGTKISPSSIRWLARLARAGSLDVRKTGFTRSMVDQLRRLLPEPLIFSDFGDFPPEPAESRAQDQKPSIDSIVARRIQELDGRGALRMETLTWEFGKEDRLPELPYVVDNVYLLDASQVTAADLQNIARLRSLRNLVLLRLTVDDDALKPLEQLASLKTLALSGEKLSAKALAPFGSCPDLRDLNLSLVPRSDGISQALSDLSGLRSLALFDVKATDVEAYSQSPGFSRLRWLDLKSASGVDDSVVSRLQERNPKLQVMIDGQIRGKNVVKEAIDTLRQRGVTFSAGVVTAGGALVRAVKIDAETPPTDELIAIDGLLIAADSDLTAEEWSSFDRLPRFYWIHSEGNPKVSDVHVAAIADNGHLNGLTLVGAQLTDASVEHLARMRHLQILNLRQTPLSRSAIERLRRLLPTTRIISEFGDETPDVPTAGNDPRIPVDAERAAALKMLRAGGLVMLQPLGASPWSIITVKPGEELPQGPFVIRSVNFRDRPDPGKVGDEVLRDLAECRHLEGLALSGTSVGPRGALYLGGSPALRYLQVSQKLPTSALRGLADLQALSSIELNVNSIDDDYAFLKSAKALRALALWGTQSPDWKKLGELTQLRVLTFPDATNLNADEVAAFQTARPECRVLFGNAAQRQMMGRNVIDEATSALLARKFEVHGSRKWNAPAEWLAARKPDDPPVVYVQSVVLRAEVTATEGDCVQIDLLNGELQQFHADGQALADRLAETISRNPLLSAVSFRNSELTDAGLAKLQSLASLRSLVLDRTRVTAAGVEKFRQAVPGCQVIFDSDTFDPQWLPTTYFDVNRRLAVRTLERGGTLLLPVATTPSAPASSPIDFPTERAAAEWVLANKGTFSIAASSDWQWRDYGASDNEKPLPSEPFVITGLHMTNSQVKTEADLERLTRCRYLENLTIGGGTIEGPAMDLLTRLPRLKSLSLSDQKNLRTSALPKLGRISTLDYLGITSEMVDDRLEFVRHLPTLRSLKIWGPQPPDIDLLAEAPQLRTILLTTPDAVDDAKLVAVQSRNDKLRIVVGWKGKYRTVGRDPAHEAAKQLVELGVECLGGVNYWQAPTKLLTKADFENGGVWSFSVQKIPASVQLSADDREKLKLLDSYHFTAEGQREADELAKSLSGNHGIATITMTDCDLSDAGLEHLQKLVSLRNINVSKSKVTPAGVERFHRAVPLCMITSDFGVTLPKFMSADTTR